MRFAFSSLLICLAAPGVAFSEPPTIVSVGMVAPDIVAVTIHEGRVELGELKRYVPEADDQIDAKNPQRTSVRRKGREIGTLAGPDESRWLRTPDTFAGDRLDASSLTDASSWTFDQGRTVERVTYFRRVIDAAQVEFGNWQAAFEYVCFLHLSEPLKEGLATVSHRDLGSLSFEWDDARTVSPAVHVSAVGFRPSDPGKRATLSCWRGDGGPIDYLAMRPGLSYQVVKHAPDNLAREQTVLEGDVSLLQQADEPDDYSGLWGRPDGRTFNRVGGPVFGIDLSALTQPGSYRVVVDGVGCSKPFRIAEDVYNDVWKLALRGLHAHRRNVDVDMTTVDGEAWTRPGAADARAVFNTARMDNATFEAFKAGETDRLAPGTRGGWMDAGDFDSNHNHYWIPLLLLDLIDRHPQTLAADDAGISDSGNGRPDLLDEALWMIDSYRMMQSDDGTVPSGIEYAEHPRSGEPSWLNTLPVYRMAPSPLANFRYAAATARAARVLRTHGSGSSSEIAAYRASALAAFAWAENNRSDSAPDRPEEVEGARCLASCELLLLGEERHGQAWRDEVTRLRDKQWGVAPLWISEAIITYLRVRGRELEQVEREALSRTLYQTVTMSYLDGSTRKSGFGVLKNGWAPFGFGNGGCPQPGTHHAVVFSEVVRDDGVFPPHIRPDRDEYVAAGVSGLAFVLGHHPTNRAYVTALESLPGVEDSWTSVRNILHCDTRFTGRRAPVGITIYGAVKPTQSGSWPMSWPLVKDQAVYPQYELWPEYENLQEFWLWGNMMEYCVWQSVGPTIWFAAELHARGR